MIDIVQRRAFGLVVIFDPMGVAETTRVLMIGIAIVCVLERRLGKCEQKAHDDAEMKHLPHEVPFYTGQTARERLKPAHEVTRRAIATYSLREPCPDGQRLAGTDCSAVPVLHRPGSNSLGSERARGTVSYEGFVSAIEFQEVSKGYGGTISHSEAFIPH